jgi:sugar O-acyltransferase (sialic acid O-acetyltransferase NeuD family)
VSDTKRPGYDQRMPDGIARRIVIVGAGGHATSVAETAAAAGYEIVAFVGRPDHGDTRFGVPIVAEVPDGHVAGGGVLVVAEGDNSAREAAVARLGLDVTPETFPALVHPSASVSQFANLGAGTVVLQGGVVGAAASVGAFCIVNTGASVDHDGELADYASIGPGAMLGGKVRIGTRTAIGIGAVVKQGLAVGNDAVLGANSYAHYDIPANCVAYGSPAAFVRHRNPGDPYLG